MGKGTLGATATATAVAVALTLAGCAGQSAPAVSPSPSVTGAVAPSPIYTPAPSGVAIDEESGGGSVNPQPAPDWNAQQRADAIAAAEHAMRTFGRPDLSSSDWWAALSPLLTFQAQQDYQYVDPANIPAHSVVGGSAIVDESSTYAVTVTVPTDAGEYTVTLTRHDGASPWLAARFTPPEGTD